MYLSIKDTPKWNEGTEKMMHLFDDALMCIKEYDRDEYDKLKTEMYVAINGYHFNEKMLDKYTSEMVNDNGTSAPKWSVADTNNVARSMGVSFTNFNEYDWNYVMNMLYSDYCDVLGETVSSYVKMATKFLDDKDGPDGKALRYAMCMKKDY